MNLDRYLKALSRVTRTFAIRIGPVRARGVPAVLVAGTGLVLAAGMARALVVNADRLPETLREARGLAEALRRDDRPQLRP